MPGKDKRAKPAGRPSGPAATSTPTPADLEPHLDTQTEATPSREPGSSLLPAFAAGQTLAGRYRIVRFIAQGGMGEVYEAEDSELRERVALKTVRPEIAAHEGSLERFKREVHLARKVTHPNVCRLFDLGVHRTKDPAGREVEVRFRPRA